MKTVGIITGARSDYGIYRPILRALTDEPNLKLHLLVCGAHLAREFGYTVDTIVADGFPIAEKLETLSASDAPADIAKSMALGIAALAESFARFRPDVLLVLGDRPEMLAAAAAALPFAIPLAHIHGGESTEGAIDETIRHAITKMSHLHFASTQPYADRIVQMGEDPARVFVTGAPSLDNLCTVRPLERQAIEERVGMTLEPAPLVVTFHPVTLEYEDTAAHISELLAALGELGLPAIFTYPNPDTHGHVIIEAINDYVSHHRNACAIKSLGTELYFGLLGQAAAMVGNSSSGVIEAASFKLPVVDIGNRQRGRLRPRNVIHAETERKSIAAAVRQATTDAFRAGLTDLQNPYGDGRAAARIVDILRHTPLDRELVEKRFCEMQRR